MSIITNTFTDPAERARAIGVWGGVFGLSMALGPVAGGALVDSVGWRGIFWVNIPVGVAAIILTALFVPESRSDRPRRPDPLGQIIVIVFLASLTYAIIEGPGAGWTSPRILTFFGLAALALIAFLLYEPRRQDPLINPRFFRSAPFSGATLTAVTSTLYLQEVRGFRALIAGLYLLPMAATLAVSALVSGRIVAKRGARLALMISGLAFMVSGVALTWLTGTSGTGFLVLSYVIFGLGAGMVNPPITNSAVSGMPRQQAGVAAAVASTSRQVGQSLGVAIMGSVLNDNLNGPIRTGFVTASRPGWWIVAACGAAGLVLAVVTTGPWARRTAVRTAALLAPSEDKAPVSVP
jgi:MFS family permease